MTKFKIESKLDGMLNKVYMYNLKQHKILRYTVSETEFKITTDRADLIVKNDQASTFFNELLFVDAKDPFVPEQGLSKIDNDSSAIMVLPKTTITSNAAQLSEMIMANIDKIKADSSFIPQAQAINESMKVFIDLAKTEVELIKALRK